MSKERKRNGSLKGRRKIRM